jgi:hypothetical protein
LYGISKKVLRGFPFKVTLGINGNLKMLFVNTPGDLDGTARLSPQRIFQRSRWPAQALSNYFGKIVISFK